MITVAAVEVLKNSWGNLVGYRLQSRDGDTFDLYNYNIKHLVISNQMQVKNLYISDHAVRVRGGLETPVKIHSYYVTHDVMNMANNYLFNFSLTLDFKKCNDKEVKEIVNKKYKADLLGLDLKILQLLNGIYSIQKDEKITILFNCRNLYLSDPITVYKNQPVGIFSGMNLYGIDLTGLSLAKTTSFERLFTGNHGLKYVNFGTLNTSKITNMHAMFDSCRCMENVDLSNFDTSNVKNMQSMFRDCVNLECLDLSSFRTKKVTNMRDMFCFCDNLSKLDISGFSTESIQNMSYLNDMFNETPSLKYDGLNVNDSMLRKCFLMY